MVKQASFLSYSIPVFAFALCFAPFLVAEHRLPISTFYPEILAIVITVCLFIAVLVLQSKVPARMPIPTVMLAPVGLAATLFVQLAMSRDYRPIPTFMAVFYCVCAIIALQAGAWIGVDRRRTTRVLHACAVGSLIGGLLSAAIAWLQAFGLEPHYARWVAEYPYVRDRRLFGHLFQANHLATVLCLAMAGAMYLRQVRAIGWATLVIADFMLAIGVAFTASRTAFLQVAIIAIGPWLLGLLWRSRETGGSHRVGYLRSGLILLTAFVVAQVLVEWLNREFNLRLSLSAAARMVEGSELSPRMRLWRYAIDMFSQHPFLGVGWGEFVRAQYLAADRLGDVEMANNAHNIGLDLLAKTGLLGASAVLIPCALWVVRIIKAIRQDNDAVNRVFCLIVVAVVLAHAMVEYPQNYAFFLLPICLMLGLAETRTWLGVTRSLSLVLSVVITAGVLIALVASYQDYKKVEVAFQENGALRYVADPAFIFGDWGRLGAVAAMPLDKELLNEKIEMHQHVIALVASPNYIRRYIVLLVLDGRSEEALLQVKRLRSLSPNNFDFQYRWLVTMCDEKVVELKAFREQLILVFGKPREEGIAS